MPRKSSKTNAVVDRPGVPFEKAVAAIQAQIDPTARVSHNEFLTDRLGQRRQFDVVIRGTFAGQEMLGVIECKDETRKAGTPEVDAFVTKAQDINANFKLLMSRKGFTKPALKKCAHYGIQPLSLMSDPFGVNIFLGTHWKADITQWSQIMVSLAFAQDPGVPVPFKSEELTVGGKRVLDWFTNYLLDHEAEVEGLGWVVGIEVVFETPQAVAIRPGCEYVCKSIMFQAERVCRKLERLVGINGTGVFNWNHGTATFPGGTEIRYDPVPMDLSQWQPRPESSSRPPSGFIDFHIHAHAAQFGRVADAPPLDVL